MVVGGSRGKGLQGRQRAKDAAGAARVAGVEKEGRDS